MGRGRWEERIVGARALHGTGEKAMSLCVAPGMASYEDGVE